MTYDGVNLILTLTDAVVNKTFTHTFPINIPATIGSNTAYIGFTGGTGGLTSSQKILTWTLTSQAGSVTQTPTFSPAGGTFTTAQSVTLSDGTPGAVIYYTIDGSTPTTSSTVYSTPISVDSGSVTIKAIAQATGFSASSVGSATFNIQPTATATPAFSPGTGTYSSTQSVTISDATLRSSDLLHHRRLYTDHFVCRVQLGNLGEQPAAHSRRWRWLRVCAERGRQRSVRDSNRWIRQHQFCRRLSQRHGFAIEQRGESKLEPFPGDYRWRPK